MSRFDELYQRELERLEALQAHLVQSGTEEAVLALHGKVLGLFDRAYSRVEVTAHKTYIRVLPLVCKEVPLKHRGEHPHFTLPWANICWDEWKNEWYGSWTLSLHGLSEQKLLESRDSEHATLRDAVNAARKALSAQLPLAMLRHRLRIPKMGELTSIFPSQEEVEREAEWRAKYWLSVEEERLRERLEGEWEELDRKQEQRIIEEMYEDFDLL